MESYKKIPRNPYFSGSIINDRFQIIKEIIGIKKDNKIKKRLK